MTLGGPRRTRARRSPPAFGGYGNAPPRREASAKISLGSPAGSRYERPGALAQKSSRPLPGQAGPDRWRLAARAVIGGPLVEIQWSLGVSIHTIFGAEMRPVLSLEILTYSCFRHHFLASLPCAHKTTAVPSSAVTRTAGLDQSRQRLFSRKKPNVRSLLLASGGWGYVNFLDHHELVSSTAPRRVVQQYNM